MSSAYSPIWHQKLKRPEHCPVCHHQGDIPLFLDITSCVSPHPQITFAICPECRTIFQLGFSPPQHESDKILLGDLRTHLKFYVEQGAGLESLVLPVFVARDRGASRYLEVGCGFGFSLDFARCAFGWAIRGIDPSILALEGRKVLGVDIESRFLTASDEGKSVYDAIAAVEVLEHIEEPYEFLKILRTNLASTGILILTTPNADYIEFAREKPGFLATLSPGSHAVLYTAKSLEIALRGAGFADLQIAVRGATLLSVAGEGAAAINLDEVYKPAIYRHYLEQRLATVDPQSILGIGLGYRLFKHLVNTGMFAEAGSLQKRLAEAVRARDRIDILDPHRLVAELAKAWDFKEYIEQLPACLVGLLYFSGMLRLNGHEDRASAITYFYAAHVLAGVFRRAMQTFGIDDGETSDLELQARRHLAMVLDWITG